ncbi:hypothetical protein [Brevibacillus reuszeri]|uniref:hypothetical protein n=1 Tax=Brevibacillus reuszeri TaxID=54915 RepID=UPI000CCC15E0|nr:hypothetical protein [Brevibacillus reuszeri]
MQWYHGTTLEKLGSILEIGFVPEKGVFGKGVYFSSSKEGARIFGTHIIRIAVDDAHILHLTYEDLKEDPIENEAWFKRIKRQDCPAIAMNYTSGECELVIYDMAVIREIYY